MVRRKSAEERKQEILDAALKLFSDGNYNTVVMDDIAKACRIARTTLYEYYSSKEDILIALVEQIAMEAREVRVKGETCREQLISLAEDVIDRIQKNKVIYRILFQAMPVMKEGLASKLVAWRAQNFIQACTVIEAGKAEGEIRAELSAEDIAFAYQAYVGQRTGELLMKDETVEPKAEAKRLIDLLWYGVGTP